MARILLIDSEVASRDLVRHHLETAGHEVFQAHEAEDALRVAISIRPDLILSRAERPGLSGVELVAAIRANPLVAPTPMLLLGYDDNSEGARAAPGNRMYDWLAQPLSREALLQAVASRLHPREVAAETDRSFAASAGGFAAGAQHLASTATATATLSARALAEPFGTVSAPQEARYGTVLFSDIRGFSTLTELLSTAEVAEVLNSYFVRACEPIVHQGGWIVKLLGDGVLALFEPTPPNPQDHAERALRAGLFHVVMAQRFNAWLARRFAGRGLPDFAVGVGVHTGDVMVVRVNTGAGVDTTIIGDTVNVASRLEEQTKKLGASLVTTMDTLAQAGPRFIPGKRGSLLVRGRASPVDITEVTSLAPRQDSDPSALRTYETIKEAVTANAAIIARVRDQVLAEPHRLRSSGQLTPLRPSDAPIRIPGYRLLRRLGQGGMSRAFLAQHEPTGALRVLKVLNVKEGGFDLLQRFVQEHEIISQVRHPSVATIYGHGQTEGHAYIVMEYFAGGDLRQRMHEPLMPEVALTYLRQVAEALVVIHARGIVHRDLKPDYLMLREDGTLVLADFGIAKDLGSRYERTRQGEGLGTPLYLSPEQALGQKVDQRSDLYALGVLLYEMLTGERPYAGADPSALLNEHAHAPVPRLPAPFERLQPMLDKLMAKRPEERFASAAEVLNAISGHAMDDLRLSRAFAVSRGGTGTRSTHG